MLRVNQQQPQLLEARVRLRLTRSKIQFYAMAKANYCGLTRNSIQLYATGIAS
jgi:hypothetical protein